jgi:5-methylcytosine-specific restriction endonuclease McrA
MRDQTIRSHEYNLAGVKNSMKQNILKFAETPERAIEIMQFLQTIDWQQEFDEIRISQEESTRFEMEHVNRHILQGGGYCDSCTALHPRLYSWPYRDTEYESFRYWHFCQKCFRKHSPSAEPYLTFCSSCGRMMRYESGYSENYELYCCHCIAEVLERNFITCVGCGKKTTNFSKRDRFRCNDCRLIPHRAHVATHLSRARMAGTPATLTVPEWLATIEHFEKKCAYCRQRPYEVLEHFIPITQGGGTTADNCVPACTSCNGRKSGRPVNEFVGSFPAENIDYIRRYLRDEIPRVNPFKAASRALMVIANEGATYGKVE